MSLRSFSSPRVTTLNGSEPRPGSLHCVASIPSPRRQAKPLDTGSTVPVTAKPTTPSGPSPEFVSATTSKPAPTRNVAQPKVSHTEKSSAASNGIWLGASTRSSSKTSPP